MNGDELKAWRLQKGLSQTDIGTLLGGLSHSAINRWEDGQDIPGPAQLLLGWLIHGKVPFGQEGEAAGRLASAAWKVEMTLEAFKKLEAKAMAAGFEDIVDYIAQLVLEDIEHEDAVRARETGIALLADAASAEAEPARQAVVYPKPKRGGAKL